MPEKIVFDGKLIRSLRAERALTLQELARMSGLTLEHIRKIEHGAVSPSVKTVKKIAKALKLSSRDLRGFHVPLERGKLNVAFSSVLEGLRMKRGMSRAALGTLVGVTQGTVRNWETGKANPSIDLIKRLAEALGVDSRAFLDPREQADRDEASANDIVGARPTEPDFDIHFSPEFSPDEVKGILTALANYYRACGGAGFEVNFQLEEAVVKEPVHA
jgi:transcriptional regulator with XRE-family HTH domain